MSERAGPDRIIVPIAWLSLLTGLLLPWWLIRLDQGDGGTTSTAFHAFRPFEPVTTAWAPHLTGALVASAVLLLFFRSAAQSWKHEPPQWSRDILIATALTGAALLSVVVWPSSVPHAWGQRTLTDPETGATLATETALPGLGWWLALLALLCLVAARWIVVRRTASAN